MNLEVFKNSDPTGKMSRETFVIKNYTEEYDYIIKFCQQHNLEDLPFKQKIYHAINNISNIVLCKNPDCNNSVNYKNSTIGYYEYCSVRCISSDPNIKKIKREKSIAKFGTKTPAESEIIKNKIVKSNNEKYGGNSPMSNKLIQYKSKKTLLKNYGVDSPSKSEEILSKRIKSFKNSGYKESYKKTSLEKYGVEHPWMNKDIHIKSIEKIKITKNNLLKELVINKLNSQNDELLDIDYDKRIIKAKCKNGHTYTINRHMLYSRNKLNTILCTICNPIYSGISGMEVSLLHHIKQVYQDEILSNERILNGKEIDIYLPKLKLGFEFNGLWWHSEENKPINYHIDKYDEAKSLGIDLIFIWEDDWLYKQEIIKSIINNRIQANKDKIYARKCEIRNVSAKDCRDFLEENHIQGYVASKYKYGLYYKNELVSLMTFGELRIPMGFKKENNVFELARFCSKLNINVVGGAQRLFKHFLKEVNSKKIISYSEISKFSGDLYSSLGFEFESISNPNYYWVIDGVRFHRYNYRKDLLIKRGYDKNKTEVQIMTEDMDSFRVWDCGQRKWVYNN